MIEKKRLPALKAKSLDELFTDPARQQSTVVVVTSSDFQAALTKMFPIPGESTSNEMPIRESTHLDPFFIRGAALFDIDLIDLEQAYFWTSKWQSWEKEADEDLVEGRYRDFDDMNSLLKDLND